MGIVTSLGVGVQANLTSLVTSRCGIDFASILKLPGSFPVGEVKLPNDILKSMLGISLTNTVSRTALLGALAVKEALDDAQIGQGKRVGLISSTSVGGMDLTEVFYREYSSNSSRGRLRYVKGHDCASSTDFIADHCGINGFVTTISTACSSAANAIIMGAGMVERGMLDVVIAGGTDALCSFTLHGFNSLMILDKELCRPLDRDRNGLNLGEGAGYVVLCRTGKGKKEYCSLAGYANANDAFHQTASSENGEGAFRAMSEAIAMAGIRSGSIDYVNLHGTGTGNNDASEIAALKRVFINKIPHFSSTKGFTGHTLAAAGGLEAVFSVLAISKGVLFPNLRFQNPIQEDVIPITETKTGVDVKCVLSNSFGFGGNCSSLVFNRL
jgi:3-oxoacyl-[acyl-carrier-protein] synthase-1